ncbi:MAG TPA: 1,4-alpha-glucan branching protein GlgB [Balneolales bacterium]|nr:1,4-alpha-glucan branching protein GlgB [Balneolales bacterium]
MARQKKATKKTVYDAISNGSYGDPFSILGQHKVQKNGNDTICIRAFLPWATKIWISERSGSFRGKMTKIHESGIFEAFFENRDRFDYFFEVTNAHDEVVKIEDPYGFGPLLTDFDLHLWGEGNHTHAYKFMGAHKREVNGIKGTHFVVSAPSAARVSVIGNFNNWDGRVHIMRKYYDQGLWEIFIPGVDEGALYKYEIKSPYADLPLMKSDPFGFYSEKRPQTASIVYEMDGYKWGDDTWMSQRKEHQGMSAPVSVYEVHMGSWRRHEDGSFLTYRELANELVSYVKSLGYTHIELMPVAEHPYDPSWGYQQTGYYATTSRFGEPKDFMYFVDTCHENGIGVLIDWVPGHFTKDAHGLFQFDGTHLYEHADPRQGEHRDWGTSIFNYGRSEVRNFLLANAIFWLDKFHIDGLRVDAVASMLYLDYSREDGEWIPNKYGGRENLEAIDFLKRFNEIAHEQYPGIVTLAEESTAWPMVSHPTYTGGLGFDYKWNMGWMNDTLKYMEVDSIFRRYHQNQITFSLIYAFTEHFILPFSHDEVVHMKRSMLGKMPGDDWQKFANLRLLYTYMYMHPGKKLLFMGGEFGQWSEWNCMWQLEWNLLQYERHIGLQALVRELNELYKSEPSMHEVDYEWSGFQWIDFSDADHSIISFIRYGKNKNDFVIGIFNFTPVVHENYNIGVPLEGRYREVFNSDVTKYGGSNMYNSEIVGQNGAWHNQPCHISVTLPPLAGIILKHDGQ